MSVSTNSPLLDAFAELHGVFPEWRMGQLVANVVTAAGGVDAAAIWDIESLGTVRQGGGVAPATQRL